MRPRWTGCVPGDTRQPPQLHEAPCRYSEPSCSSIASAAKNRRDCVIARQAPLAQFSEPALDTVAFVIAQAIDAAMFHFDLFHDIGDGVNEFGLRLFRQRGRAPD